MARRPCMAEIEAAAGGKLPPELIEQIVERLERKRRARRAEGDLKTATARAIEDARKLGAELKLQALIEKRNRAFAVLAKRRRFDFYDSVGNEAEALRALNVGSEKPGAGMARSADAETHALEAKLLGPLFGQLRQGGLLRLLRRRTPEFDRDVAREMWAKTAGEPRATGNTPAQQVADILVTCQEMARRLQNDSGAWIRKMPGYIVRQSHDRRRIARAGFDDWRATIEPLLDERTFDDAGVSTPAEREQFLRDVWVNLATGNHQKAHGGGDWLGGFTGPGNLAKRLSSERVLHFKSADAWFDYNQRFGASSLLEAAVFGLRSAARNTAVLRAWGPNPEAAFTADVSQLAARAKNRGDLTTVARLENWLTRAQFDQVTGAANIADSVSLATHAQTVRNLQSMAKLGGVVLSALPDLALVASTMRHQGMNFFGALTRSLADTLGQSKDSRAAADLIGVGLDGLLGGVLSRFSATDDVPGKMTKLMNVFFKANLLSWWTDAHSAGAALMLARWLGRHADRDFGALPEDLARSLQRYGLGAEQWAVLRQAQAEGMIMPDRVAALPDTAFAALDARRAAQARLDLELGLRAYLSETTRDAMTFAGARERALIGLGTRPGTPVGEAVRFFMQFKTFGVTIASRHLRREVVRKGKVDVPGLATLIATTWALGWLSMQSKAVVKGREPRPWDDWRTLGAAFVQGGGMGIYGDFLFGEYNRFGGGAIATLGGPAVGTFEDVLKLLGAAREGEDVSSRALRLGLGNVPFVNLFYTRAALDYAVLYQLQEWMNPGALQRMERRLQKDQGQRFIVPPSRTMPRGGGSRLFEGVR